MASFGIAYKGLPLEVLDAFGHDPAAVTGATRKYRGWRAVDDIHRRLVRQREVFKSFLSLNEKITVSQSVLDDPIGVLVHSLKDLETHQRVIASQAVEVERALQNAQAVHGDVKAEYKSTLSHTSVVYPEVRFLKPFLIMTTVSLFIH